MDQLLHPHACCRNALGNAQWGTNDTDANNQYNNKNARNLYAKSWPSTPLSIVDSIVQINSFLLWFIRCCALSHMLYSLSQIPNGLPKLILLPTMPIAHSNRIGNPKTTLHKIMQGKWPPLPSQNMFIADPMSIKAPFSCVDPILNAHWTTRPNTQGHEHVGVPLHNWTSNVICVRDVLVSNVPRT